MVYTVGAGAIQRTASDVAVVLAGAGAVCSTTCSGAEWATTVALDMDSSDLLRPSPT